MVRCSSRHQERREGAIAEVLAAATFFKKGTHFGRNVII